MSQLDDPKAGEELTEQDRFRNSDSSTIKDSHAVLRCVADFGDMAVSNSTIVKAFFDAGSKRKWDPDSLEEALMETVENGWLERLPDIGHRITEAGRNEAGPMLEMELKYV